MFELVLARVLLPGSERRFGRAPGPARPAGASVRRRWCAQGARPRCAGRTRPQRSAARAAPPHRLPASGGPAAPTHSVSRARHPNGPPKPPAEAWPETAKPGRPAARPQRPPRRPRPNPLRRPRRHPPQLHARPPVSPASPPSFRPGPTCSPASPPASVIGVRKAGALLAAGQPVAVKGYELVLAFTAAQRAQFPELGHRRRPCFARPSTTVSAAPGRSAYVHRVARQRFDPAPAG